MKRQSYNPKGIKVKARSRPSIRSDAHLVLDVIRAQMPIPSVPFVPIERVVEWMDSQGFFHLELEEDASMGDKAAELQPSCNDVPTLIISDDIYDKACDNDNFARFTLAHELGHYFLHSNQAVSLPRVRSAPVHKAFEDSEWQANTFAGEMLVDSRLLYAICSSSSEVPAIFGVSKRTAEIQWEEGRKG